MSAWYIFSALGFYPVNPVSGEYVVGRYVHMRLCYHFADIDIPCLRSPFYDQITIKLPASEKPLVITSRGAGTKPFVASLTINGRSLSEPVISHADIVNGGHIVFEMSETPTAWGSGTIVRPEAGNTNLILNPYLW